MADIGDLIFDSADETGRLRCDGGLAHNSAYSALRTIINNATVAEDLPSTPVSGLQALPNAGQCISFSPNGQFAAVAHWGAPGFTVFSTSNWSVISNVPAPLGGTSVNALAFSPDSSLLAVASQAASPSSGLTVIQVSNWSILSSAPSIEGACYSVAFSPDGTYLAVGCNTSYSSRGNVAFFVSGWERYNYTPSLAGVASSVAFSPDGRFYAVASSTIGTGNSAYRLRVADITTNGRWNQRERHLDPLPGGVTSPGSISFSPDGRFLAVVCNTPPYYTLLHTDTWIPAGILDIPGSGRACAFSPDGTYLAVTHSNAPWLSLFATDSWQQEIAVPDLPGEGRDVTFSPNGAYLGIAHQGSPFWTLFGLPPAPPSDRFRLPNIPNNPHYPDLPVLIQAEEA